MSVLLGSSLLLCPLARSLPISLSAPLLSDPPPGIPGPSFATGSLSFSLKSACSSFVLGEVHLPEELS